MRRPLGQCGKVPGTGRPHSRRAWSPPEQARELARVSVTATGAAEQSRILDCCPRRAGQQGARWSPSGRAGVRPEHTAIPLPHHPRPSSEACDSWKGLQGAAVGQLGPFLACLMPARPSRNGVAWIPAWGGGRGSGLGSCGRSGQGLCPQCTSASPLVRADPTHVPAGSRPPSCFPESEKPKPGSSVGGTSMHTNVSSAMWLTGAGCRLGAPGSGPGPLISAPTLHHLQWVRSQCRPSSHGGGPPTKARSEKTHS